MKPHRKYMINIEPKLPDIEERPLDVEDIKRKAYPKIE